MRESEYTFTITNYLEARMAAMELLSDWDCAESIKFIKCDKGYVIEDAASSNEE